MNLVNLVLVAYIFAYTFLLNATPETQQSHNKPIRVYADMVGDLFHAGHINFLKQARAFGDYLIVGVNNDKDCESYKRRPILTMDERIAEISACKYVDEVVPNAPILLLMILLPDIT